MPIEYVRGDVLSPGAPKVIAHGCNMIGVMGAGFAVQVKRRFPACYGQYRDHCKRGDASLGSFVLWTAPDEGFSWAKRRAVFNLFTQPKPGACATIDAVHTCLVSMLNKASELGISTIGMPWIGCGLGGLNKPDVARVLNKLDTHGITLKVYDPQAPS